MTFERQVIAYKNYFLDFYGKQADNVQAKIEWTLNLIRVTRQVPEKYFMHLKGTINENYSTRAWRTFKIDIATISELRHQATTDKLQQIGFRFFV
jgi:hypothetical protein